MSPSQKPQNYRQTGSSKAGNGSFDIKPPAKPSNKSAAAFPAVGMTLNTYQSEASQNRSPRHSNSGLPKKRRFDRFRSIVTPKRSILVIVALIVLTGGWLGWKFVYNAHKLFGGNVFSALTTTKLKGESAGRVNILLAGNSADDPGHQGGTLTDSIMVMSVDTQDHTAFMLSIPRDLYVAVPGDGHQKINAVYPFGQSENFDETGYTSGGMGLLEKVIQQDMGIDCDYYALVDYNALRDAVNDVGGVDITIASSDKRGLYDPSKDYATNGPLVKLTNGVHHLDGEQALDLSRARGDAYGSYGFANSDFDRTAHQRQLILALRSKATSAGVLANPIKLGKLFDAVGGNVKTDFNLSELHRLYDVTKGISGNNIQSIGLNNANGKNLLMNAKTAAGDSLIPAAGLDDYDDIQQYIQQISSNDPVVREGASVVVLNGTSTSGLAAKEAAVLKAKNLAADTVADADNENYTTTQIIDLSGGKMPASLKALQQSLPGSVVTTTNPLKANYTADFIVIIGTDQIKPAASTN